jgi:hypothetical protein
MGARQAIYLQPNIVALSRNHCFLAKAVNITYSECVSVALVMQHAKRIRRFTSFVASLAPPYFPHCLINGTIFGKKRS